MTIIGYNTIGTIGDITLQGKIQGVKAICPSAEHLLKLSFSSVITTGALINFYKGAIYDYTTLVKIAETEEVHVIQLGSVWIDMNFLIPPLLAIQSYWLVVFCSENITQGVVAQDHATGSEVIFNYSRSYALGFPNTLITPTTYSDYAHSIYGTLGNVSTSKPKIIKFS